MPTSEIPLDTDSSSSLSPNQIFRLYLPLAFSWLFMGMEGPIAVSVISRLANPQVNTAAFWAVMSLAIWIESPVIDLLSTSTTLVRGPKSLKSVTGFTLWLNAWVTIAHAVVIFSPLYDVVMTRVIGLEAAVSHAAHPALMIMTPWSALIGWRRYRQGILIRNGETKVIGIGTALRVCVLTVISFSLAFLVKEASVSAVAAGLVVAVAAECLFIHIVSTRIMRSRVWDGSETDDHFISLGQLLKFHLPLTATTMVKLMTGLIIGAGLARTLEGTHAVAGFQVAGTVIFLFRAMAFCLPEVVIALYREKTDRAVLKSFCLRVGMFASGGLAILALSGLDHLLFSKVFGAAPDLVPVAHVMLVAMLFTPFFDAVQAYVRGVLTAHRLTLSRMTAVVVSTTLLVLVVAIAVRFKWSPAPLAGVSLGTALLAEFGVLAWSWAKSPRRDDLVR